MSDYILIVDDGWLEFYDFPTIASDQADWIHPVTPEALALIEAVLEGLSEMQLTLIRQAIAGQLVMSDRALCKELERYIKKITVKLEDTPCPTCGGSGEVDNPTIKGGKSSHDAPPAQCPACEGTGRRKEDGHV